MHTGVITFSRHASRPQSASSELLTSWLPNRIGSWLCMRPSKAMQESLRESPQAPSIWRASSFSEKKKKYYYKLNQRTPFILNPTMMLIIHLMKCFMVCFTCQSLFCQTCDSLFRRFSSCQHILQHGNVPDLCEFEVVNVPSWATMEHFWENTGKHYRKLTGRMGQKRKIIEYFQVLSWEMNTLWTDSSYETIHSALLFQQWLPSQEGGKKDLL